MQYPEQIGLRISRRRLRLCQPHHGIVHQILRNGLIAGAEKSEAYKIIEIVCDNFRNVLCYVAFMCQMVILLVSLHIRLRKLQKNEVNVCF